ncbi:MAG: recombinase family protein [Pseudomonadota bacterium]
MKDAAAHIENTSHHAARAVIYCRVSSLKQVTEGGGLGSQETRCREYAKHKRYEIAEVFADEGVSGSMIDRPGMQAMLTFLRKHKRHRTHVVIIDDISRLARGLDAHIHLRSEIGDAGGKLESPSIEFGEDSDSILVENLLAAVSQHQRQKNAEQVINRMRARVINGYWVWAIAPVGYKWSKIAGHGKMLVPDEPIASIVRNALEGFASGLYETQAEVHRYLQSQPSFPLNKNGRVHFQKIRQMLERSVYAGYIDAPKWGLSLIPGKHEPLISIETYSKIQERLNSNPVAPTRANSHPDFLLRGFISCGECGSPLTGCYSKGRNAHYGYYFCQQKSCSAFRKNIRKEQLESDFEYLMNRMRPSPEVFVLTRKLLQHAWDRLAEDANLSARDMRADVQKTEIKIEQLMERIIQTEDAGLIDIYERQMRKLNEHKLTLEEKLRTDTRPQMDFEETYRTALEFLANPGKLWASDDPATRNLALKLAFDHSLPYWKNGGFRTAGRDEIALPFKMLAGDNDNKYGLVEPRGIEPLTSTMPL